MSNVNIFNDVLDNELITAYYHHDVMLRLYNIRMTGE